jgi:hypothetical protein
MVHWIIPCTIFILEIWADFLCPPYVFAHKFPFVQICLYGDSSASLGMTIGESFLNKKDVWVSLTHLIVFWE